LKAKATGLRTRMNSRMSRRSRQGFSGAGVAAARFSREKPNGSRVMGYTEELKNRIQDLLEPLAEGQGLELVDLELHRARRGRTLLRIFLDRPGGITLEEITRFSRVAGELLDVHDLIPESYNLEVSSPGLTRELKKPRDYERYAGRLVRLTTRSVINGRQVHRGILLGLEADVVTLEEEGQVRSIPLGEIARARLDIDMKKMSKEG